MKVLGSPASIHRYVFSRVGKGLVLLWLRFAVANVRVVNVL